MEKEQKRYTRRVRNLIFIFVITAVLVTVSTYAWFIGMRTVTIDEFSVQIKSTDSLMLSLDGLTFSETVSIDKSNFSFYDEDTNTWGGNDGLIPISSVGVINTTSANLELYEKASVTPSPGGFRLLASQVDNNTVDEEKTGRYPEQDGYVAFDLYIRNFTGSKYIREYNEAAEEAIYLTVDSGAKVSDIGDNVGVEGTGIENSVRVGFAQIGRTVGTITVGEDKVDEVMVPKAGTQLIRSISCKDVDVDNEEAKDDETITGICNHGREAVIWEPNDVDHVPGAISYYQTACRERTGEDVTETTSYTTENCSQVIDGLAYPTYAINSEIDVGHNVDVYDGKAYNTYEDTESLTHFSTFTDTMKLKEGMNRPVFMTLAPNSITKVRVYVWIEGQDIDNYDFAQIGKAISVKFGFTKQRFTEDDVKYTGPETNQGSGPNGNDKNPPVITIEGFEDGKERIMYHENGKEFTAPAVSAVDNVYGEFDTEEIEVINKVNIDVDGTYTIIYRATDVAKNVATKTLKVIVNETGAKPEETTSAPEG
ncbi:MAG: immunoglobulin-like domain-containing protein [Bacilli bacterium]